MFLVNEKTKNFSIIIGAIFISILVGTGIAIAPKLAGSSIGILIACSIVLALTIRWPEIFLIMSIWTIVIPTYSIMEIGGNSVIPYIIFEIIAMAGFGLQVIARKRNIVFPVASGFFLLHICVTIFSMIIAHDLRLAIVPLLRMALHWLMVFLLLGLINSRKKLSALLLATLVQAMVIVGLNVFMSLENSANPFYLWPLYLHFQKNEYATYLAFATVLAMGFLNGIGKTKSFRILSFGLLVLVGVAWPINYSRTGLMAILTVLVSFVFLSRNKKLIQFLLVIAILLLIAYGALPENVKTLAETAIKSLFVREEADVLSFTRTINERIILNQTAFETILQNPIFGIGYNQWAYRSPVEVSIYDIKKGEVMWVGANVHNRYLLVAVESGLFAIIGYLGFLAGLLKSMFVLRRKTDPWMRIVLNVEIAAIFGFMVANLFIPGSLWEWTLLGISAATVKIAQKELSTPVISN